MDTLKNRIATFFDSDSSEYLEHKYAKDAGSYMALRRERANEIFLKYLAPEFNESYRFVDCGCGPGILLDVVAKHRINYWGTDISEEMLKLARTQPADGSSRLVEKRLLRSDVESLPFKSESFDAAASLGVIEYLEGDDRLVSEMARIVKPGGYVLIAVTNRYSYNLLLEKPSNWLRANGTAAKVLNFVKVGLKLGAFRQAEFEKRRHSPQDFTARLGAHGLEVVETASWGFNFLPHPFQHICGGFLNRYANAAYSRSASRRVKLLGEGYMVLCRRQARS